MADEALTRRTDGKYEEHLGNKWLAEYYEDVDTGLWSVDVFFHDVPEWASRDFPSLEDARAAARDYLNQR